MNGDDERTLDAQLDLLATIDDARLSDAGISGSLDARAADPECVARLERNLALARRLDRTLNRNSSTLDGHAAGADAEPPWKQLGRFQIVRELGRGGCGLVFLAHDPLLDRQVALKVPRAEIAASSELRARFCNEARAAAALDHPNLVKIFEVGEVGPVVFLVSEYSPGITLDRWLADQTSPVPHRLAAALVASLAETIGHAHNRGVLHRDLKPGNVMLNADCLGAESEPTPKILDFGLARLESTHAAAALTHTGAILGTVQYMAPEQAAGSKELGPGVDIYALGVMLYELLTSRLPHTGQTNRQTLKEVLGSETTPVGQWRADVPRALQAICHRCLQKDPAQRYVSAADLAGDLRCFLSGRPLNEAVTNRTGRSRRRRRGALAAALLLACLALLWRNSPTVTPPVPPSSFTEPEEDIHPEKTASTIIPVEPAESPTPVQLLFDRGQTLCKQGDLAIGLLCLAQSLVEAPAGNAAWEHTVRTSLADWQARLDLRLVGLLSHKFQVRAIAFSSDGSLVARAGDDGDVKIWDVATAALHIPPLHHESPVRAIAFSPRGDLLLAGCRDGHAYLWDVGTGQRWGQPLSHAAEILAVAFDPAGDKALTASWDKSARCWNVATQEPLGEPLPHDGPVMAAAFSPDGQSILTGSRSNNAWLWDAGTLRRREPLLNHSAPVYAVGFDPARTRVVTAGKDGAVRFWNPITCSPLGDPLRHADPIYALSVSPTGELWLGSEPSKCFRYRLSDRTPLGIVPLTGPVKAVAHSPSGGHVAAGGPHITRLWKSISPARVNGETDRPADTASSLPIEPRRLLLSIEVLTGFELDGQGLPRALDLAAWTKRRELLSTRGDPSQ